MEDLYLTRPQYPFLRRACLQPHQKIISLTVSQEKLFKQHTSNNIAVRLNKYFSMMFLKNSWLKDAWNAPRLVEELMTMQRPSRRESNSLSTNLWQLLITMKDLEKSERLMPLEVSVRFMPKVKMPFYHRPSWSLEQKDQERQQLLKTCVKEPMQLTSTS